MHSLSLKIISCMAVGLGKGEDYFNPWFKDECSSTFRAIHYNPRQGNFDDQKQLDQKNFKLVTPEHCDSGFVTLLSTFMFHGLQVEIDGEYRSIEPVKNAIIVNLGETLQRISDFKIKATSHRVYDIGAERFSCPFFLEPKFSARISNTVLDSSRTHCEDLDFDRNPANSEEVDKLRPFGEVLCKKLTSAYGEWKGFEIPEISYDYSQKT